jgi:hypothetical protein
MRSRAASTAGTTSGACFSGISRPAKTTSGSAGGGAGLAAQDDRLALEPLLAQSLRVHRAEAERLLGDADAEPLDRAGHASLEAAQVLAPVAVAPHLVPVDGHPVAAHAPREAGAEHAEVRRGADVHDVVRPAVGRQVPRHAAPEAQRLPDRAVAVGAVELLGR